jgi:hypothetical protein
MARPIVPSIDPKDFDENNPRGNRPGRGSIDPAPDPVPVERARPARAEAPAPVTRPVPPDIRETTRQAMNTINVPADPPAQEPDTPEVIPASREACRTHRDLELWSCSQAGIAPPPRPASGLIYAVAQVKPAPPPTPPEIEAGMVSVRVLDKDGIEAMNKVKYRQGQTAHLPSAEADLFIRAGRVEVRPGKVWFATLLERGLLLANKLITRNKPELVDYDVAMAKLNPETDKFGRADPSLVASKGWSMIVSEAQAKAWDPSKLRRDDPAPPVGRPITEPWQRLPKVRVRVNHGTMIGRYAAHTGAEISMDEECAIINSLMEFPEHSPFAGKCRVVILEKLSREGEEFFLRVRAFAANNPNGWSVNSRDFPKYPGLERSYA